ALMAFAALNLRPRHVEKNRCACELVHRAAAISGLYGVSGEWGDADESASSASCRVRPHLRDRAAEAGSPGKSGDARLPAGDGGGGGRRGAGMRPAPGLLAFGSVSAPIVPASVVTGCVDPIPALFPGGRAPRSGTSVVTLPVRSVIPGARA